MFVIVTFPPVSVDKNCLLVTGERCEKRNRIKFLVEESLEISSTPTAPSFQVYTSERILRSHEEIPNKRAECK